MALPDIFARRKRNASGESRDVYSYDKIPQDLRIQVIQIFQDAIGPSRQGDGYAYLADPGREIYEYLIRMYRREAKKFHLTGKTYQSPDEEFYQWILDLDDTDLCISAMESALQIIDIFISKNWDKFREFVKIKPEEAISEFNGRFDEDRIGFHYEGGQIIQIDSKFLHKEVVVPALNLISGKKFEAINNEFRKAHGAYRDKDYENCLVECCKAFESTLKVIGRERHWAMKPTDSAKGLLDAAYAAGFIPATMQAEFTALRGLLESAVPGKRNKMGGHGAGDAKRTLPRQLAAFQLHQTAAAIVFLLQQHETTS